MTCIERTKTQEAASMSSTSGHPSGGYDMYREFKNTRSRFYGFNISNEVVLQFVSYLSSFTTLKIIMVHHHSETRKDGATAATSGGKRLNFFLFIFAVIIHRRVTLVKVESSSFVNKIVKTVSERIRWQEVPARIRKFNGSMSHSKTLPNESLRIVDRMTIFASVPIMTTHGRLSFCVSVHGSPETPLELLASIFWQSLVKIE